jgi:hypothetical protein
VVTFTLQSLYSWPALARRLDGSGVGLETVAMREMSAIAEYLTPFFNNIVY